MNIDKIIKAIATEIDEFINDELISKAQIASYIVGSTMMRDDYDDIILVEPKIEILANTAADLEIIPAKDKFYTDYYFTEIIGLIKQIKEKYNC